MKVKLYLMRHLNAPVGRSWSSWKIHWDEGEYKSFLLRTKRLPDAHAVICFFLSSSFLSFRTSKWCSKPTASRWAHTESFQGERTTVAVSFSLRKLYFPRFPSAASAEGSDRKAAAGRSRGAAPGARRRRQSDGRGRNLQRHRRARCV